MIVNMLMTGNELMTGVTVDSNSAWLAQQLIQLGMQVHERRTVGDELQVLVKSIQELSQDAKLLIVNGGLGPTSDDLTAEALAKATGVELEKNAEALAALEKWASEKSFTLNDANLKQAYLPKGCEVVLNPTGSASGFAMNLNDCLVICTPGVPSEMRYMYQQSILPILEQRFAVHAETDIVRLQLFGTGESTLQQLIHDHLSDWPKEVEIGFRAGRPQLELKLTIYKKQHATLRDEWLERLKPLIAPYLIGYNDDTLAVALVEKAKQLNKKLTTAESCTGGKIAHSITTVPGASTVFEAGFVTYSNKIKQQVLDVSESSLIEHGAVSQTVVEQMLKGALEKSAADAGVAISGIAGPDGGTEEKPVGTVWIAWGHKDNILSEKFLLPFSREWFQELASSLAMDLLRRFIEDETDIPDHFKRYRTSRKLNS